MITSILSGSVVYVFTSLLVATILVLSLDSISYAQNVANLVSNPNFTQSSSNEPGVGWTDHFKNCQNTFKCTVNSTTGWKDNTSLQLSTKTNRNTWSHISGTEISVKSNENYDIVTHMKLNQFATQSHIAIEGYNQTTKEWNQIAQCPLGTNGPLQWQEFSCELTIPSAVSKIRPVLNAGWSSQPGKEAETWFDAISIVKTIGEKNFIAGFIPSAAPS